MGRPHCSRESLTDNGIHQKLRKLQKSDHRTSSGLIMDLTKRRGYTDNPALILILQETACQEALSSALLMIFFISCSDRSSMGTG